MLINPLRKFIFRLMRPYLAEMFRVLPSFTSISDLRQSIVSVQKDANQSAVQLRDAQGECSARQDQLERSFQQLGNTNAERLEGFKSELEGFNSKLEGFNKKLEELKSELDGFRRSLYAAQMDSAAVSNRLISIEKMLEDHFAQICGLREMAGLPSFSQVGEDRIVDYIFERQGIALRSIRYLDIGAAFPSGHNNTYLFYKAGASGCLVEADPEYFESYKALRPRDSAVHAAIVPARLKSAGSITFHRTSDRGWSTASDEHLALAHETGKVSTGSVSFEVPALTIMEIIEKHVGLDPGPDLISLDIEGLDFEVLIEIDFEKVRPKVLVLENKFDKASNTFSLPAIDFLRTKGYSLYASTQINSIFVENRVLALIKY